MSRPAIDIHQPHRLNDWLYPGSMLSVNLREPFTKYYPTARSTPRRLHILLSWLEKHLVNISSPQADPLCQSREVWWVFCQWFLNIQLIAYLNNESVFKIE